MRLAWWRALAERFSLGPHGSMTLIRTDGTILARLPGDAGVTGQPLQAASPFYRFMRDGTPQIEAISQVDHVKRHFVYRRIGDLPLVLSVGLAVEDIYATWQLNAAAMLALVAIPCLVSLGLVIMLRSEVHRRAAAGAAVKQQEAEFRLLTENVGDVVARVDPDGVYRYVSSASRRVLGIPPDELIGRRIAADVHPDDRAQYATWLERLRHDASEPTLRFRRRAGWHPGDAADPFAERQPRGKCRSSR
jgi:PAS domain-containing protein